MVKKHYRKLMLAALFVFVLFVCVSVSRQAETGEISQETRATIMLLSTAGSASAEDITRLIQEGANVNAVISDLDNLDLRRFRPLIYDRHMMTYGATSLAIAAAANSDPNVLLILIENGANVNATPGGWPGINPLALAASSNPNPEIIRTLIENGAYVSSINDVLLHAARHNSSPGVLKFLMEYGADVNAVDVEGNTPLIMAAWHNSTPEILQFLLDNGADMNVVKNEGSIFYGTDIRAAGVTSFAGETPLMLAAMNNSNQVMRVLIANGADVNATDRLGRTSLMRVAQIRGRGRGGHFVRLQLVQFMQTLLDNGADINIRDNAGRRAIDYLEGFVWSNTYHFRNVRVAGVFSGEIYDRSDEVVGGVNLNLFHPWSGSSRLPRLDSPASFRISDNFPRLDGATSAYPIFAAVANEVFEVSDKAELQQYLFVSRTAEAYNRLIRGVVDVIFVLQPSEEQLKAAEDAGAELQFTPIAKDGFVFFVNRRNPVSGLSIEQIRDIYRGNVTNWQEVGGSDREILPFQRPANSGSQTAMINEVMRGEELIRPLAEQVSFSMTGPVYGVAQYRDNEEAIGYSFRFFTEEMMRDVWRDGQRQTDFFQLMLDLIPVDTPDAQERRKQYQSEIDRIMTPIQLLAIDGVYPSKENIRNGTYPFTVDVFAVTAGTSNPHVQELIDWMLSPEGQELIERVGYVGIAADESRLRATEAAGVR